MHIIYSKLKGFCIFEFEVKSFSEYCMPHLMLDNFLNGSSFGNGEFGSGFDGDGEYKEEHVFHITNLLDDESE